MRAPVPATASTQARVAVATPERWHDEVERRPFGGEQAADRRADGERDVARGERVAVGAGVEHRVAVGAEHGVEHGAGGGQACQHARARGP